MTDDVLVVAGEASGDRMAAAVARALGQRGRRAFGLGGRACRDAGVELVADAAETASMGIGDVAARAPALARACFALARRVRASRPRAALLVGFTELNARLGRWLRGRGAHVVWCAAPQVWAWRAERLRTLRGSFDRLAVILPFEEALWKGAGHDAHYVGHPSVEAIDRAPRRDALRSRLGVDRSARALAVLPGSRPGEVRRLARVLCDAAAQLASAGDVDAVRVMPAAGLDPRSAELVHAAARERGLGIAACDAEDGAAAWLGAFDATLAASGTASLEAALAGACPVVAYKMGRVAFAVARRLVAVPRIALPNVLLGRDVYPELLQDDVTPEGVAASTRKVLRKLVASGRGAVLAHELTSMLALPPRIADGSATSAFGARVAALL